MKSCTKADVKLRAHLDGNAYGDIMPVLYFCGARLGLVLGNVFVLCVLVCGDVFYLCCALGFLGFQCC